MKVYFLRHGIAEEHHAGGRDADRELTKEGIELVRRQAEVMARLDMRLDAIISSPLVRAMQTAEIAAKGLGLRDRLSTDDRLAYGFRLSSLREIVAEHGPAQRIMLVGHNPDMPRVAAELTGCAALEMKKGGLIRVETAEIQPGAGVLEWHVPPAVLVGGRD